MNISNSIGYIGEYIGRGVMIGYIGRGVKILYNRCKLVDNIFFGGNDVQKKDPKFIQIPRLYKPKWHLFWLDTV